MTKATDDPTTNSGRDWASQPLGIVAWWGLPIAIGAAAIFLRLPFHESAGLCSALLAWMAMGCLLNARRCHRLHCYISGPVLLLGAVFAGVVASGVTDLGQRTFGNAVSVVLVLALLSFVPEMIWKRYA